MPSSSVRFPPIRLWAQRSEAMFNADHYAFLRDSFTAAGYSDFSISPHPRDDALNLVIEYFPPHKRPVYWDYFQAKGKRIGIIMTEHIDWQDGNILFHGRPLDAEDNYLTNKSKYDRIKGIQSLLEVTACYLRLGELPELKNYPEIFPGPVLYPLPYPAINPVSRRQTGQAEGYDFDLAFVGFMTDYREEVTAQLKTHFHVGAHRRTLSRHQRDAFHSRAKIVLNIPQRPDWLWPSPLRIYAALRAQRGTIHIGANPIGVSPKFCAVMPPDEGMLAKQLMDWIENPTGFYKDCLDRYNKFIQSEENGTFPHHIFEEWAQAELYDR